MIYAKAQIWKVTVSYMHDEYVVFSVHFYNGINKNSRNSVFMLETFQELCFLRNNVNVVAY